MQCVPAVGLAAIPEHLVELSVFTPPKLVIPATLCPLYEGILACLEQARDYQVNSAPLRWCKLLPLC